MKGTISDEIEVNVPANVAWELYGTLHLSRFIVQELPTLLDKVEVIEGDGSTGTVLKITFPQGTPGIPYFKERLNIVDNEKRYKQSEVIEGGYVDLGYIFYGIRFEVIEKDENSCITKFTVSYEVEDVKLANHAFTMVEPLQTVIKSAKTYLITNSKN
ncbi:norbelladine synthase-like [Nicotiana tabacum]|uniref:Norbelladine synthase-like n=1 Tax=Nicotiana tabacum TaxID=4097 RepID=A0A1S4CWN3_TOBAC|nr:S-norcoclaurine synthase 2-like [Nicotiana tomentosiformis]XP_016505547.1 PREDICTED: S-norcoclaurine synthase 2-like [Nicotiana tabacum]